MPLVALLTLAACLGDVPAQRGDGVDASAATLAVHDDAKKRLPFHDTRDLDEARRGLLASPGPDHPPVLHERTGEVIWEVSTPAFLKGQAPETVHPSLWRQAKLNSMAGLFEVVPGIYQLRGFDLSTLSVIRSKTGWIAVDPGTTRETGRAARAFLDTHLLDGEPIRAVIFTHSHIDHFGGIRGFLTEQELASTVLVAPEGFVQEASSENILLGPAMARRAAYQYGRSLPRGPKGAVGLGLGRAVPFGSVDLAEPNLLVREEGETHVIDGVPFEFQVASGTEAPAEITFFLPELDAFCGAEVLSRNLHNLYTLRGAKVRDALHWAQRIDSYRQRFHGVSVVFNSHHWPIWGEARITSFFEVQRDTYKFIHDQTVRMILQGATPREIAHTLKLPPALQQDFHNQGYYGTVAHNSRAVYQFYMGWYDANPAHLHPLPRAETSPRYVELMGGADKVVAAARQAHEAGDDLWAAELLDRVVFAHPDHTEARTHLAETYEQLAYQAESGPWRSAYLMAADELRRGVTMQPPALSDYTGLLELTAPREFLQSLAARVNPADAEGLHLRVNVTFTDSGETFLLQLSRSVLHIWEQPAAPDADVSLQLTKALFVRLATQQVSIKELMFTDDLTLDGSLTALVSLLGALQQPDPIFPIVTP